MKFMRWTIFAALLWVAILCPAHADETESPVLEAGVRMAYGRVGFFRGGGVERASTLKYRNGLALGGGAHFLLHARRQAHFGIQPELLFVHRGAETHYEGLVVAAFQLSYVELPILGRLLLPFSQSVAPYIVAGPRFGVLLSAERTDSNGNVRDESSDTNMFDFGFSAGAGALIHAGSRVILTIEGRYDQSLMNRLDFDGEEVTNDQRHRAFFLTLGVSMGIGSSTRTSAP